MLCDAVRIDASSSDYIIRSVARYLAELGNRLHIPSSSSQKRYIVVCLGETRRIAPNGRVRPRDWTKNSFSPTLKSRFRSRYSAPSINSSNYENKSPLLRVFASNSESALIGAIEALKENNKV